VRPNKFILSLLGSIILAYFFPTALSSLPLGTITDIGIGFIFFFYGLKMAPAELKEGFLNYPSHILIQSTTFLIFPLLTLAFAPLFEEGTGSDLWLALFFLGVLPSTVSSSVVMVAIAKGNLPTAIFNASISGLIGILATPLLLSIFIAQESGFDFMSIILKLVYQIVLPLLAGLFLQQYLGVWARRHNSKLSLFDKAVIVLIVYSSFSNSFNSGLFSSVGILDLVKLFGIVVVLFFLVYWLVGYLAKLFHFSLKNR
jgi:solute carrier family 10 (sodium/bile acid cotransporter), member 7